jgi:hypothetical protein
MVEKEGTIKNVVGALYGWSIEAKESFDSGDYKKVRDILGSLNKEAERLEWSRSKHGLKRLPNLEEVKTLKKKISEARAGQHNEMSGFRWSRLKKGGDWKKKLKETLLVIIKVLGEAWEITKKEPWIDPKVLSRPKNKKFLCMFLRSEKYYSLLSPQKVEAIIKEIDFEKVDLSGEDFSDTPHYIREVLEKSS